MNEPRPFLTAEWRHLVMLSYAVPQELLEPYVPAGTTLDTYQGAVYASIVGLMFKNTRVLGWAIPRHREFEEVNLRFYVRRFGGDDWRRGVVFIKELVPRFAVAALARSIYNENYAALPMSHSVEEANGEMAIHYEWRLGNRTHSLRARSRGVAKELIPGSLEEFITEHYWGYVRQRDKRCVEYRVEHPRWPIWTAEEASLDCDVASLYGEAFAPHLCGKPASAFIAEGSPITVFRGERI